MSKLTKAEKDWIAKVQAVLNECPSKRLGFYTVGDCDVSLYDLTKQDAINKLQDTRSSMDFGPAVDKAGASFDARLIFPSNVHSTAG